LKWSEDKETLAIHICGFRVFDMKAVLKFKWLHPITWCATWRDGTCML